MYMIISFGYVSLSLPVGNIKSKKSYISIVWISTDVFKIVNDWYTGYCKSHFRCFSLQKYLTFIRDIFV